MKFKHHTYRERLMREIEMAHGERYPASLAELSAWVGCDYHTAHRNLARLENDGLVLVFNRGRRPERLRILPNRPDRPVSSRRLRF